MLYLLRHGRTASNAAGLLLGRADPPLDALGRAQATAAAAVVGHAARVVSSPLRRARETAAALGPAVDVDERWIEVDYGEYDERPLAEVPADVWARWRSDLAFAPPGGESLQAVGERVRAACADLADEAAERDVVIVSHVSPLKAAVAWALGVGDEVTWRMFVAPAGLATVAIGPRGPSLRAFNETGHLRGLDEPPAAVPVVGDPAAAGPRRARGVAHASERLARFLPPTEEEGDAQ